MKHIYTFNVMMTTIGVIMTICLKSTVFAYQSSYDNIQWDQRENDTLYCIDITDENWNVFPGFQAIKCAEDMYNFSPSQYVRDVLKIPDDHLLSGLTFYWRVWSPGGYGGNGFEGVVTVDNDCGLPYRSDAEQIQWGCRFRNTFYCIDIFDENWNTIHQAAACGENLHSFSPQTLNLLPGLYRWKVWSESAYNYWSYQAYFEGEFNYEDTPVSSDPQPINLTGIYSYNTFNPELNGNCSAVYELFGCYSAASCIVIGVRGTMDVTQIENDITIDIIAELNPGQPIAQHGNRTDDGFVASISENMSEYGCNSRTEMVNTGHTVLPNSFSGHFDVNISIWGSCMGYSLDCNITADYTASKSP